MRKTIVATAAVLCAVAWGTRPALRAADHGDSPQVRDDTRADINDLYVFASPETPANTVLAMTVCPLAGITGPKLFAPGVKYQFAIDVNGDAVEDQVFTITFSAADKTGHQKFALAGPAKLKARGVTEATTTFGTGAKVFTGLRDDPFFFDLIGFKKGAQFSAQTSRNFFAGLNTMAIVVEVPTTTFGTLTNSTMGVWVRTLKGRRQIDRMGRPAINTALISGGEPGGNKDLFNRGSPKTDVANWHDHMVANLKTTFGRSDADAQALTAILLPDVLTYNPTDPGGFLNGRKLTDDVIDAELNILTNGVITTDFVANDSTFLATFPYLGVPNP